MLAVPKVDPDSPCRAGSSIVSRQGFNRSLRIVSQRDFARVLRARNRTTTAHLELYTNPNAVARARLGIVIPKQRVSKAVDRNTLKRVIREEFRLMRHGLQPVDYVVRVRARCGRADKTQIAGEARSLFLGAANP